MRPVPFSHVTLFLRNRNSTPLTLAVTTSALRACMRARSSFTPSDQHAVVLQRVRRVVEFLRGLQQRLGRDAADIQAGAAERGALLHAGDLHAELRRADGAHIAAGSGADDDDVEGIRPFRCTPSPNHRVIRRHTADVPPSAELPLPQVMDRVGPRASTAMAHRSSSSRRGSSTPSFTRTRKLHRLLAIDDAVIVADSARYIIGRISILPADHHRPFLDLVHAQDRRTAAGSGSAWTSASRRRRHW